MPAKYLDIKCYLSEGYKKLTANKHVLMITIIIKFI